MGKILSYSLFHPKVLPQHRFHDKWKQDRLRYWFNLPAAVITNKILYPDYQMVLHVSKNIWDQELSSALEIVDGMDNLTIETIDMDYTGTEPAIWRMMPLWSREVEVFHTRDIDSIPTEMEYKYVRVFEESDCSLGVLRTHPNHYGIKCRMLAGLSSFKPQRVPLPLKLNDFYMYYAFRHNNYGSDQDLMIQRFTSHPDYTRDNFLDHRAYGQENAQDFPCVEVQRSQLDAVPISQEKREIFDFLKSNGLDNWAGEPVDARGAYTNFLFQNPQFEEVVDKLREQPVLREFYGLK